LTGLDEFLNLFGNVTISTLAEILFAGVFLFCIYTKIKDYMINKHETEKMQGEQIAEALSAVRQYPEYRMTLEKEIQSLREGQEENTRRLVKMEDDAKRRERNRIRDTLLQNYRYYTSSEHNPVKAWTKMESEAFWELFGDYESVDGDGYVHSVVQPEMNLLTVIEMDDAVQIANLMKQRR
jgi:hypothetical protein